VPLSALNLNFSSRHYVDRESSTFDCHDYETSKVKISETLFIYPILFKYPTRIREVPFPLLSYETTYELRERERINVKYCLVQWRTPLEQQRDRENEFNAEINAEYLYYCREGLNYE
jgi:hypothetical protein